MSYTAAAEMASSPSLITRIAACAAQEGVRDPVGWANANIWTLVARQDWVAAWAYARGGYNINLNPDTGQRDDVINDSMILAAVQAEKPSTP